MAFNLADYEPVAARLSRWLDVQSETPKRVITHLMQYSDQRCVFKAELWQGEILMSTGWAEETRGEGHVNRTSHFENCETSAIGRALANAGFAGSDYTKRPSREEMQKVERTQDYPIDRVLAPVVNMNHSTATTKQMNYVKTLLNQFSPDRDAQAAFVTQTLGEVISLADLSSAQASKLIAALKT